MTTPSNLPLTITADYQNQRLDNYLLRILKGVPKSLIYRLIRQGAVRVNQKRIKPEYRLQLGDELRLPNLRQSESELPNLPHAWLTRIEQSVIFEDEQLIVLNKPVGLAVHRGSGVNFGAIDGLRALRPQQPYLELAHRLDRDTSGCLLFAKTATALQAIQQGLLNGTLEKRYVIICLGQWRGKKRVEAPLRKGALRGGERLVMVSETGQTACTEFTVRRANSRASWVDVQPITGRTHQIRVHAAHVGHPIAGDERYGDAEFNQLLAVHNLRRLFLHAIAIKLPLPQGILQLEAPLDGDWQRAVDYLNL